jgi:hypothetical protein
MSIRNFLVWFAVVLLAACNQPETQPLTFHDAPWQPGELSEYQITDVNGQPAGIVRFAITTGDNENNTGGWTIQRETAAQGVHEVVTVEINALLRPLTSVLVRTADNRQESVKATYASGQIDMELTTERDITTYDRKSATSDVRDGNVLLVVVRAMPLAEGYATRINSFLPSVGIQETFTVNVVDTEAVTVPTGSYETFKVELNTQNYSTTAWFTQAPPFALVKYIDGRNQGTFELINYQSGR